MNLQIGDKVTWTSQARSYTKTKRGVIVDAVPAGFLPREVSQEYRRIDVGTSCPRKHDSYIVEVGNKLYWPRVKNLKHDEGATE